MKYLKIFFILIIILSFCIVEYINSNKYKVLDVIDYKTVVIDLNKNFQKDSDEIIIFDNFYIPENLPYEDKFLMTNLANEEVKHILLYKFIDYSPESRKITLSDKDFSETLTNTHLIVNKNAPDEEGFRAKLNELKAQDYVLVNTKSKRFHKLTCDTGIKSKNFKLIPRKYLPSDVIPCKSCIDEAKYSQAELKNKNSQEETIKTAQKQTPIEKGEIKIFPLSLNEIKEPQNACKTQACLALLKEINSAQKEILFAIYGIHNQTEIYNALVNAQKRGVEVKWVSDYSNSQIDYYPDTAKLKEELKNYNDDYSENKTDSNKLMHNKFFIFDEEKVFTGSSNITQTDLTGFNANYAVLITSKALAKQFKDEFIQMYSGKFHNAKTKIAKDPVQIDENTTIKALFSPKDKIITSEFIPLIQNSKNSIDISVFYLTHKTLKDELINARKRGVKIRIINDATNASNQHSIHHELRKNDIPVKTENYAGKNHSKIMIIDGKYTVLGSMNFTSSGENKNDENVLIIDNKDIAAQMTRSFEKIWQQIPDKYLKFDPPAESTESVYSCFDGVDNDFDGKIDNQDEGCTKKGH